MSGTSNPQKQLSSKIQNQTDQTFKWPTKVLFLSKISHLAVYWNNNVEYCIPTSGDELTQIIYSPPFISIVSMEIIENFERIGWLMPLSKTP